MRTIAVTIAALIAVAGCKQSSRWRDGRAATAEIGGFVVRVPQGWRNSDELADDELRAKTRLPEGAVGLVPEDLRDGYVPSIVLLTTPVEGVEGTEIDASYCHDVSHEVDESTPNRQVTDVQVATFDGDPGCTWSFADASQSGRALSRFHRPALLLAECMWPGEGTEQLRDICAETLASIKPR